MALGVHGREIKAAIRMADTWGTPVACGGGDGVLLKGDSLKRTIEHLPDDSLGMPFARERDQGQIKVEGSLDAYLRYDSLDLLLALAMGTTGGAPTQPDGVNDPNTWQQTFTLADLADGLFATIAINKAINVFEYPTAKVTGFTLKGEMGKPMEISFDVQPDDEDVASSTNDLTSFASVTWFETAHRVLMSQGTFRMNDQSGAALGSGDVIRPSSFELTFKRPMEGVYVAGGSNRIDEPAASGTPEITLKLTFPRYTSTTYLAALGSDTRKKMDITFEGETIDTNYKRTFTLSFPHLAITNAEAATTDGQVQHPLELSCMATDAAPSGMTVTAPFQVDVINRKDIDVLA